MYGIRASKIGELTARNVECLNCDGETSHISVFGRYFHILWIPILPFGRKAVSECITCKKTIRENEFPPKLKKFADQNLKGVKRPKRHWAILTILGGLISLFILLLILIPADDDPRRDMLKADVDKMSFLPVEKTDSVSYRIKILFDGFASEDIEPSEFKYYSRILEDRALILVKIPNLKKVKKEGRLQALELIEAVTGSLEDLKDKEKYIGVHGKFSWMITKTPAGLKNSRLAVPNPLFDFYGPKLEVAIAPGKDTLEVE